LQPQTVRGAGQTKEGSRDFGEAKATPFPQTHSGVVGNAAWPATRLRNQIAQRQALRCSQEI